MRQYSAYFNLHARPLLEAVTLNGISVRADTAEVIAGSHVIKKQKQNSTNIAAPKRDSRTLSWHANVGTGSISGLPSSTNLP